MISYHHPLGAMNVLAIAMMISYEQTDKDVTRDHYEFYLMSFVSNTLSSCSIVYMEYYYVTMTSTQDPNCKPIFSFIQTILQPSPPSPNQTPQPPNRPPPLQPHNPPKRLLRPPQHPTLLLRPRKRHPRLPAIPPRATLRQRRK